MRNRDNRSRHPRASDAWRYPGMDSSGNRLEDGARRHWRHNGDSFADERRDREYDHRGYYHNPSGYPDDRGGYDRNEGRYYDSDIYEQEFDDRMDGGRYYEEPYEGASWGNAGRQSAYGNFRPREEDDHRGYNDRRYDDDDRHHRNFFERAGERLRDFWNDWRGRDERDGFFHERFREDPNERRYGRDNWAPNANRGSTGRRNSRYRDYSY